MTKSEYIVKYNKSFDYPGLHCAMIFHHDPILDVVECRSIYAEDRVELVHWFEVSTNFYRKNKIDFVAYIDGVYEAAYGDVTQYFEEEE